MFDELKDHIISSLPVWGYPAVFFGVMLENAGLPVPGETILLTAGFLSFKGKLELIPVILTAFAGAVIGDNIGFLLGYKGGRPLLEKYGKSLSISRMGLERTERLFRRHGGKIIFVARFITGLRVFAAVVAGVGRMDYSRFFIFNVSGAVLWATTIALVGYFFGHGRETISSYFKYLDEAILVATGAGIIMYIVLHLVKKERNTPPAPPA